MKKLTGSEKQIKWAEDIRKNFVKKIGGTTKEECESATDYPEDFDHEVFQNLIEIILKQESASWWIEQIGDKMSLDDITMIAEDHDEEDMEDFLNAYKIKA